MLETEALETEGREQLALDDVVAGYTKESEVVAGVVTAPQVGADVYSVYATAVEPPLLQADLEE